MGANTRKILIVEDDPWVARLLEFSAHDFGWETVVVRDGLEAAEIFAEELPDAVVTDAVLPNLDGLELCRRIKSTRAGIITPIIIFSGVLHEEMEPLTRSRADAFFAKPLSPDVVATRLISLAPPELEVVSSDPLPPGEPNEISLGAQPLPLALARLYQQRQSGVLHIRSNRGEAEILLRDGNVVQVRSPGWTETLADALVRLQKVSADDAVELRRAGEKPEQWYEIGSTAVSNGQLAMGEPERLWAASQSARVLEVFRWTEGFHRFAPRTVEPSTADLTLDSAALIHWGLRRADLPDHALEQAVPSLSGRISRRPHADDILRLLPLSASEKWLLERADGATSLQTLARQIDGDGRATDALVRSAIVLHALGSLAIDIPPLAAEASPGATEHQEPGLEELPAEAYEDIDYDLRGTPAQMLLTLWQSEATGIFAADTGQARYLLYLRRGQLVASRSNEIERLDSLLAQRGRIRADVLPRIRQLVQSGRNVGEALLDEKAIAAPQLHAFVRGELRASLGELFRAPELAVSFTELPLPLQELAPHEWDTGQAVVEAARAQDLAYVNRLMPAAEALLRRAATPELASVLTLSPAERALWNLLVAPRVWRRLSGGGPVSLADQQRALAVLLTVGIIEVGPAVLVAGELIERPSSRAPISLPPVRRRARDILALPEATDEEEQPSETVPRAVHEKLLREKEALEARLAANVPDEESFVSREMYEQLKRDKVELKARVASLLAQLHSQQEELHAPAEAVNDLDSSSLETDGDLEEKTGRFTRSGARAPALVGD